TGSSMGPDCLLQRWHSCQHGQPSLCWPSYPCWQWYYWAEPAPASRSCQALPATEPRSFSTSVSQFLLLLRGDVSQTSGLWFGTAANGPTSVDPRECANHVPEIESGRRARLPPRGPAHIPVG